MSSTDTCHACHQKLPQNEESCWKCHQHFPKGLMTKINVSPSVMSTDNSVHLNVQQLTWCCQPCAKLHEADLAKRAEMRKQAAQKAKEEAERKRIEEAKWFTCYGCKKRLPSEQSNWIDISPGVMCETSGEVWALFSRAEACEPCSKLHEKDLERRAECRRKHRQEMEEGAKKMGMDLYSYISEVQRKQKETEEHPCHLC